MTRSQGNSNLFALNPEIERTLGYNLRHRTAQAEQPTSEEAMDQNQRNVEENPRTMMDFARPSLIGTQSSIERPQITAHQFEIKPNVIQMVQHNAQFYGLADEDPNAHLAAFLELCDTFRIQGASEDAIRLRLFPFSLRDRAKQWLNSLPFGSISTWEGLAEKFLSKYFPPSKTARMRNDITSFVQLDQESLYEAWERYRELLRKCPHHGLPIWLQVQTFYNALNGATRQSIDAAAGGTINNKTPEAALELLEEMAMNSYQWSNPRPRGTRQGGLHPVDGSTAIAAQLEAISKKMDAFNLAAFSSQANLAAACTLCGTMGHSSFDCQAGNPMSTSEQVDFVRGQSNPYSNTYNAGWRNHPNFSWRNNEGAAIGQQQNTYRGNSQFHPQQSYQRPQQQLALPPPGFQQRLALPEIPGQQAVPVSDKLSNLEEMFSKYMREAEARHQKEQAAAEARYQQTEAELRNQRSSVQCLENQLGQMAKLLSERPPGSFPSNTEINPRGQAKAIILRSGRQLGKEVSEPEKQQLEVPPLVADHAEMDSSDDEFHEARSHGSNEQEEPEASSQRAKEKGKENEAVQREYKPAVPYPARLKKGKVDIEYGKFLELFKQLHINIPLIEAISQMPKYAKFLKDLVTNKRKLEDVSTVELNEVCSSVLQQSSIPKKLKDPGSFTIPCYIGSFPLQHALADLGASINLMPYSLFCKLNVGDLKPTRMSVQLADRSVRHPRGVVEDILVRVNKFTFPVDFVIFDMKEDNEVPLILGRPFLATARAIIDVNSGELVLRVGDEQISFNVFDASRKPADQDDCCYFADSLSPLQCDMLKECAAEDELHEMKDCSTLELGNDSHMAEFSLLQQRQMMPAENSSAEKSVSIDDLDYQLGEGAARISIEEPPTLELKPLPSHLEYAFLAENSNLPVIIAADLAEDLKDKLLAVLKRHKKAIAWQISDIKGINPSFCTHKISLEEDAKSVVQPQRRLNPNMKEVVRKEVLKLLDAGIIYPISDSSWVSPVQVVPKKGGTTVVSNAHNELIPTRTVTGWRVCIDYRKLNDATRKDHFPLPFIDQMLERLCGHMYYCFLDGFSGYFQICIAPEDQEKTTFTCPYGTFAYRRMPFGLCNAPGTFQRCMMAIFEDFLEQSMEVFMDDFSVFGNSFDDCLAHLEQVLIRCEETNLVLNWEKCHFMVQGGIVLGHKISSKGLEVDKAKVETIAQLPPPTSVKGIRSFLGHAGFYRRFIKDFSKIARPLTKLLEKDAVCLPV